MKLFKLSFFSVILSLLIFSSCTNNEPIFEDDLSQIEESASITQVMEQFRPNFNQDGSLNTDQNPNGNILFDFCFEFVYPLNLSYNNGTLVTVDNLEDLIDILINTTDALFVDGITFPFQVEIFNSDTNAIEVQTINNEQEFAALLESCGFDDEGDFCTEEYNPVCVEISYNGETITVTFPNTCYAEYEGFTAEDFVVCEDDDYNGPANGACFTYNFPISLIVDGNETVIVNSQEELNIALYTTYNYVFVYPFDISVEEGDATVTVTINSAEDIQDVLNNCYGIVDCECSDDLEYNPVCVETLSPIGATIIVTFENACLAECEGFTAADFVDCDTEIAPITDCITFVYPIDLIEFNSGNTITVNSNEEMNNTYNPSNNEFVLPFNIMSEGAVVTVNTPNDLWQLLDDCN